MHVFIKNINNINFYHILLIIYIFIGNNNYGCFESIATTYIITAG